MGYTPGHCELPLLSFVMLYIWSSVALSARLFRDIANASLGANGKMRLHGNRSPWQYFLISITLGAGNPRLTIDS